MALLCCPTTMPGSQLFAFHGVLPLAVCYPDGWVKTLVEIVSGLDDSSRKV